MMEDAEKQPELLDERFKSVIKRLEQLIKKVLGPTKKQGWARIGSGFEWTGMGPQNIIASATPIYEAEDGDLYYDREGKMSYQPDKIRDVAYQLEYDKGLSKNAIGFGIECSKDIISIKQNGEIQRFDRTQINSTLDEKLVTTLETLANDLETLYAFQTHAAEPVFHSTSAMILAKIRKALPRIAG